MHDKGAELLCLAPPTQIVTPTKPASNICQRETPLVSQYLKTLQNTIAKQSLFWEDFREGVKYYFADFVRKGGTPTPPPLYGFFFRQGGSYGFGGYPPPPFTDFSPKKNSLKRAKNGVFKTPDFFSAKRGLRIWGVPPPPLRTKSAK